MINIEGLSFQYSGAEQAALKDINLSIRDGEFVLVTGPSGGGKSTLCRCCNGLIPHFYGGTISGRIEVDGINTFEHSTSELATKVAMVFQDPENQLVTTDVEREIAFGLENLAIPERVIARRIEESLDTLGIVSLRHRPLQELSGGEKQKVAIASVLALHPSVLILDEPTSELDPKGAEDVLSVLLRLNDELGLSIILVEHRMDRVVQFADRLIIVDQGTIVADGPVDELMNHNYDIITSRGIAVPPIIRLVQQIKKKGSVIEKIPLTVKEGRFLLEGSYRQALPQKPALKVQPCKAKQLVRIDKLWHSYNDETAALKGVSFAIDEGEFVAIMGRNASGKTTLVKHFNRLLEPSKGRVTVDGIDTRKSTIAELAKKVGFIFQNPNDHLFADTVEDELSTTLKNLGLQKS